MTSPSIPIPSPFPSHSPYPHCPGARADPPRERRHRRRGRAQPTEQRVDPGVVILCDGVTHEVTYEVRVWGRAQPTEQRVDPGRHHRVCHEVTHEVTYEVRAGVVLNLTQCHHVRGHMRSYGSHGVMW